MEDAAQKIQQLTESLQQKQGRLMKKKDDIESLNKDLVLLDKDIQEQQAQYFFVQSKQITAKNEINSKKEELRKQVDISKRVKDADKAGLEAQKIDIQARIEKIQAEVKALQNQKSELLKSKQGEFPVEEESKGSDSKNTESEEDVEVLKKNLKVEKDKMGFLTVETLTAIVEICTIVAGKKFRESIQEARKKRRAQKNKDLKSFLDHTQDDSNQHVELFQQLETEVLKEIGVEKSLMDKSIEYYLSAGNMQVVALMNLLGDRLKTAIHSTKDISRETLREILTFKNEFIEKEGEKIFSDDSKRTVIQSHLANVSGSYAQKQQMSLSILRNYLDSRISDLIFEKFGVEEEDIMDSASKPELSYDMEIATLIIQGEEQLFKFAPQEGAPGQQMGRRM